MGFLDSLRSWFASESAEAKKLGQSTQQRLETELDRREAELAASPSERIEMLQDEIADSDTTFDALRDKIEGRSERADATAEVAEVDQAVRDGADEPSTDEIEDIEIVEETDPPGESSGPTS